MAFRGVGKSWITSAYVVWRLRIDPQLNFLVVSASKDRADAFSNFTQRLIYEMPILQCLIPNKDQRRSMVSFDVAPAEPDHSPSVKSVGIFGQLTGTRADVIIADDVEVANNSLTQVMRDRLSEAVKEFDAILKPGGEVTYLGTPQTESSIYSLLQERGYEIRVWTARYPDGRNYKCLYDNLAPMLKKDMEDQGEVILGKPTDPDRFNHIDLLEREASYGRSGFALQFMLDTSISDNNRYPLKLSDLIVMSVDRDKFPEKVVWSADPRYIIQDIPAVGLKGDHYYRPMWVSDKWVEYQGRIMAIDPSGRGEDETGYAVLYMCNGYIVCPEFGGLKGGYSDATLQTLCNIAKRNRVQKIIVEDNFGDGMFTQLLKPHLKKIHPCDVEGVRASNQMNKERRIIDVLEPILNQHRLIIDLRALQKDYDSVQSYPSEKAIRYMLAYQLTRITKEKNSIVHDDRLDALAIGVNYWVEAVAQDADENARRRKEQLLEKELKIWTNRTKSGVYALVFGDEALIKKQKTKRKAGVSLNKRVYSRPK
jgi:hypothetical protein